MSFIITSFLTIKGNHVARPIDPEALSKITLHVTGGYHYATTRPLDGKVQNKSIPLGTVTDSLNFIPGYRFFYVPI